MLGILNQEVLIQLTFLKSPESNSNQIESNQFILTLSAPIPQNGKTQSNNLSAICRQIV